MGIPHIDRIALDPGRVLIQPEDGSESFYATITLADNPIKIGTPLNKPLWDSFLAASGVTDGDSTAYTLEQEGFQLVDGALVRFKLHVDSGATPTLNINGTGAKRIKVNSDTDLEISTKAGTWLTAVYSATLDFFVLQGSGNTKKFRYHSRAYSGVMGLTILDT